MLRAMLFLGVLGFAGCDKPGEEDCKKAFTNMQKLYGAPKGADEKRELNTFVRECRSQFSGKDVRCVVKATTAEEVNKCLGRKEEPQPPPAQPAPPQPIPPG